MQRIQVYRRSASVEAECHLGRLYIGTGYGKTEDQALTDLKLKVADTIAVGMKMQHGPSELVDKLRAIDFTAVERY